MAQRNQLPRRLGAHDGAPLRRAVGRRPRRDRGASRGCASCRAELATFQSTRAAARRALDADEPPARAHQAILRAAAAAVAAKQPKPIEARAAAAAAVVLGALARAMDAADVRHARRGRRRRAGEQGLPRARQDGRARTPGAPVGARGSARRTAAAVAEPQATRETSRGRAGEDGATRPRPKRSARTRRRNGSSPRPRTTRRPGRSPRRRRRSGGARHPTVSARSAV